MNKIIISAPGKLMLMGEHAVVYDHSCLAAAINKRLSAVVERSEKDYWIDKKFVEKVVLGFRKVYKLTMPVKINITSDFSSNYGFGSSSAITVATAYGLYQFLLNKEPDKKELFDFCYQIVLEVQGKASGFDVAAAIYGGIIYFETGGKKIEQLPTHNFPLVVGYSGTKANTVSMINLVREKMQSHKTGVNEIFNNIGNLVCEAKTAILEKDLSRLGVLMNFNQEYLEDLGVSTEKLDDMIIAARKAGALGAKISGAGGGDCMIALTEEGKKEKVKEAIKNAGGEILDIAIEQEGVRTESDL
jgi:mevalonate kinase